MDIRGMAKGLPQVRGIARAISGIRTPASTPTRVLSPAEKIGLMEWSCYPVTNAPDGVYSVQYGDTVVKGVVVEGGKFNREETNIACYKAVWQENKKAFPLRYRYIKEWGYIPHRFIEFLLFDKHTGLFHLEVGS